MKLMSKLAAGLVSILFPALFYTNVYAEMTAAQSDDNTNTYVEVVQMTDDIYMQIIEPEPIISYPPVIPENENYAVAAIDTAESAILPLTEAYSAIDYYVPPDIHCRVSTISVSSLKITWDYIENHEYAISCMKADGDTTYSENICLNRKTLDTCYVTGLRENTIYLIRIVDLTNDTEESVLGKTEKVNITQTYDYIPGWTNCFTYESASALTHDPSKSAIAGAISDPVTDTGIMRDEYGDYCCAMGLYFGRCGDRFLVELENGTQFTVKICDSKGRASDGQGKYHTFGRNRDGKSVIEFIHGSYLPSSVYRSGNYGCYDWDGLKFDNIKSISKIDYGDTVVY